MRVEAPDSGVCAAREAPISLACSRGRAVLHTWWVSTKVARLVCLVGARDFVWPEPTRRPDDLLVRVIGLGLLARRWGGRCALGIGIGAVVLSGCASAPSAKVDAAGPDSYLVGPLRVLLRAQPEVEFVCRLHAQQQTTFSGRILGCYVPAEQAIVSTPDARVLLHEFKHYFEGPFHD